MFAGHFASHVRDVASWETIAARQYISLACLICVGWEHLLTIGHEYMYVWKSRFSIMKWLYLLLRYLGLSCQLANHVVTSSLLSKSPIPFSVCATWFAYQSAYIQVLNVICETIMIIRVWALWHRSVKVAFILFSAFACEVIVMVYFAVRINLDLEYNDTCLIERTPKTAIGVVLPPILMQCLILALTLYKRYHNRDSLYPPPLVELVSRDGSAIFVAVSATFAISLSYSAHVHVLTHSVWSILATLLTIGGSRVVMNMQRLKVPFNARTETSDIQLTSYVATGTALVVTGISPSYFDPPGDLDGMEPEFPS